MKMMERLEELRLDEIHIDDGFWNFYRSVVRDRMLPYQWEILNDRVPDAPKSHCVKNFKIAAGLAEGEYYGQVFQDSDIAKWLEAVAYALAGAELPELEAAADQAVDLLRKAQQEDGYLDTYYTIKEPGNRWSNLREGHELYVAGHMIEAAAAYYENTGKRKLLDLAVRMADNICRTFGPEPEKIHGCPGHPEIELALVKLYRVTGEKAYLDTAKYFLDLRGTDLSRERYEAEQKRPGFRHIFPEFEHLGYDNIQAHKPVRMQKKAAGHAVRALYLYSAMADAGVEAGDESLVEAAKVLFDNVVKRQMFLTGGVGSAADGECFTCDYDLPNNYNYSETCASVALMMLGKRLFQTERDGKYMDIAEQALYNTVLGGMSLKGTEFFYVNPLEVVPEQLAANRTLHHVLPQRRKWMGVACCPPNIARTVMNLGSYMYAKDPETLFVNLYVSGKTDVSMETGCARLEMRTGYPFEEQVAVKVTTAPGTRMRLAFREPGWTRIREVRDAVHGRTIPVKRERGYLYTEILPSGETAELSFCIPLRERWMQANPRVPFDAGKAALMRGPLVYCLEEADNGKNLAKIRVDPDCKAVPGPDIPGGERSIPSLKAQAFRVSETEEEAWLYREFREESLEPFEIRAVPYCMWNNRGVGEMRVWLPVVRKTGACNICQG